MSDGASIATPIKKPVKVPAPSVTNSARSQKNSQLATLKEVDYKTVLSILRQIENQLEFTCEVYDNMLEASKRDYKINADFQKTVKNAESERKY